MANLAEVACVAQTLAVQDGQAGPGQFIPVTTGRVGSCGTAGLTIVKGNHLWCCVCVYSGKRISAPGNSISRRDYKQMIPGNKCLRHLVSSD